MRKSRRPADYGEAFDINAMRVGGWLHFGMWSDRLVPWIIDQCVPKADGRWWPTHCWEIKGE